MWMEEHAVNEIADNPVLWAEAKVCEMLAVKLRTLADRLAGCARSAAHQPHPEMAAHIGKTTGGYGRAVRALASEVADACAEVRRTKSKAGQKNGEVA